MEINKIIIKNKKKLYEYKSSFISMKEDELQKINIKSNELFQNETRNNMVKWLVFLCDTLHFNIQTLLRSVLIFDKFISVSDLFDSNDLTQEKMNLITIACLSLGTKFEEINCNYVKFFTDKVLNLPDCQIFSIKDLTSMEMTILKQLNYKTIYTTSYDFLLFYIDIFKYFFNITNNLFIENIKTLGQNIIKENINKNIFLSLCQSDFAFICLQQAFFQLGFDNFMTKIKNILLLLLNDKNMNNDLRKNEDDDNRIFFNKNTEINLMSF